MDKQKNQGKSIIGAVFLAYFILILHGILVLILGVCVVFFKGIVTYMFWIFIGGIGLVILSGYFFYTRIKKSSEKIRDILNDPNLRGRSLELSFFGGAASLKLGQPHGGLPSLDYNITESVPQLESPETTRVRELAELAGLLKNNLITPEEYKELKQDILNRNIQHNDIKKKL
ncbi:SHOCT domain-containing protein [Candidatus Magnetomoraceae bacterium gMMP-15]